MSQPVVPESVNFINFNQNASCISVGTTQGYKIFNCDPFGKCYSRQISSVGIVEMLYVTSLLAVVGVGEQPNMSPRRLKIINTKRQTTICELTFPTTILSVKLNKERMVVVLEEQMYIYDVASMKLLHTIETLPNPTGLVALSPVTENNYLAYPSPPANKNALNINVNNALNDTGAGAGAGAGAAQPANSSITSRAGDVIIFNTKTLLPYCVIEAHKATLAAIALSSDGLMLASASVKGTIIRVFSVETGQKLYQFRRGTYGTKIHSLSFSNDNKFLTASSATDTVHIFKLNDEFQVSKFPALLETQKSRSSSFNSKAIVTEDNQPLKNSIKPSNSHHSDDDHSGKSDSSEDEDDEYDIDEADERDDSLGPLPNAIRRLSGSSEHGSVDSDVDKKVEPVIDQTRRSVGRLIRKSSQSLGRRAAETMGIYLPKRVTSVLKPIRHFASLKIPASNGTKSIVAIKQLDGTLPEGFLEKLKLASAHLANEVNINGDIKRNLLEVIIVTSNGLFLKYALDGERGGDCILLSQYSLLDGITK